MKTKVIYILIGVFIGLIASPVGRADQAANEIRSYIGALREIITIMRQIQVTSQETADNTKAIKEKLGAK